MKKIAGVIAIVASLFLIAAGPADARGRGGSGGGRGGGFHHGFHGHHGFHPGFRTRVFIGPGWGPYWGPYWYPPYYPVDDIPIVAEPTTYIEQSPAPSPTYWYYCESARAYYPYVQQCPGGWLTVVPPPTEAQP